jgi:hypothetical protein
MISLSVAPALSRPVPTSKLTVSKIQAKRNGSLTRHEHGSLSYCRIVAPPVGASLAREQHTAPAARGAVEGEFRTAPQILVHLKWEPRPDQTQEDPTKKRRSASEVARLSREAERDLVNLPKSHERRIDGHRHEGSRLILDGPTLVHALEDHAAHPGPFGVVDPLEYWPREPPCRTEARDRRTIVS